MELSRSVVIACALLVLAGIRSACAQIDLPIEFTTTFPFAVGNTTLPAGTYTVRADDEDSQVLTGFRTARGGVLQYRERAAAPGAVQDGARIQPLRGRIRAEERVDGGLEIGYQTQPSLAKACRKERFTEGTPCHRREGGHAKETSPKGGLRATPPRRRTIGGFLALAALNAEVHRLGLLLYRRVHCCRKQSPD